jgi:transcriptional regulator with XRE-family HTH domain
MPGTEIGAAINQARRAKKWTLRQLEQATGFSNAHLSQIETGKIARPGPMVLWKMAGALDLDYAHLLELAGHVDHVTGPRRSLQGAALSAIGDLDPAEQEEALKFMDALRRRRKPGG